MYGRLLDGECGTDILRNEILFLLALTKVVYITIRIAQGSLVSLGSPVLLGLLILLITVVSLVPHFGEYLQH